MSAQHDRVDEALELLRSDDHLELPPPFQAPRTTPRRRPVVPTLVVALGLGAAAAAGGLETLRSWWFGITVDGEQVSGWVEGSGERTARFMTDDGCEVTVRVARREEGTSTTTGIEVTQVGPSTIEHDVETRVTDMAPPATLTRRALTGGDKLHEWLDAEGVRWALYLTDDPEAQGSRLLLHEVESDGPRPVSALGRTERRLARGARAEVIEEASGEVRVILDDGTGVEFELVVAGPRDHHPATEYRSPDGRVHVRVDD